MPRRTSRSTAAEPGGPPTAAISELGIDIVRVERIRRTLGRFGARFLERILTPAEAAHVRGRPESIAGRWAAKEAVSKVLGLGVRGVGWREIEIERLPTGQPAVRLHGRAARRAEQLGLGRIACSISHEDDYAVAVAYAVRTAGGRYVFPPDIEERLEERERRLVARLERLRGLTAELRTAAGTGAERSPAVGERGGGDAGGASGAPGGGPGAEGGPPSGGRR